ncbi:Hint domain-containing protein [Pontibacter sp. CAU 1760]
MSAAFTLEDYKKLAAVDLGNPEQDTYMKFDNTYVLDREAKPYVFNYSDGVERKIYLYKIMKGADRTEVGTLALYSTPKSGKLIKVCVPGANADKKAWDFYIDELKYNGEKEQGFLSTLAFALSREYAHAHANAGKTTPVAKDAGDYDFCFPEGALVELANGTTKPIERVAAGDEVMAINRLTLQAEPTTVTAFRAHFKGEGFALTQLVLLPTEEIFAAATAWTPAAPLTLTATANHPILTAEGQKEMGAVQIGDVLYHYDHGRQAFRQYRVAAKVAQEKELTKRVYNLETKTGNYLINGTVVLDK